MSAVPAVSVIMPVYNGEATIARSIATVQRQTLGDFELIVVDDGSTDRTAAIVSAIADPRIRLLSGPNAGPSASRNRGIAAARGALIAFLDADDLWTSSKLERQRAALAAHPRAALTYSWTDCMDERDRFLQKGSRVRADGQAYELLVSRNFLDNGSSPMVRRTALDEAGGFDESLWSAEDWDLWLRIAHRHELVCVPEVQVLYVVRPQSNSSNVARQVTDTLAVLERALARVPDIARREPLRRTVTANLYKYVAVRLIETSRSRADGQLAARYWLQFVRATPTPIAHAGKAAVMLAAIGAILTLPSGALAAFRGAIASLRGRRWRRRMTLVLAVAHA